MAPSGDGKVGGGSSSSNCPLQSGVVAHFLNGCRLEGIDPARRLGATQVASGGEDASSGLGTRTGHLGRLARVAPPYPRLVR